MKIKVKSSIYTNLLGYKVQNQAFLYAVHGRAAACAELIDVLDLSMHCVGVAALNPN